MVTPRGWALREKIALRALFAGIDANTDESQASAVFVQAGEFYSSSSLSTQVVIMRNQWAFAAIAAAAVVLFVARDGRAATLLIDDFASPTPSKFYIVGSPDPLYPNAKPLEEGGLPTTLGDERDTLVEVLGTPNPQSAQFLLGVEDASFPTGVFHLATAGTPATVATLQYDGDDADGDTLTNAQLLDISLPANGSIDMDFVSVDAPGSPSGLKVDISLTSIGGGTATFSGFAPESDVPSTLSAPLASFIASPEFDPGHISSITFVLNEAGLADADFTIDNLRAVPEPGTWALALLSAVAVFSLRRRV